MVLRRIMTMMVPVPVEDEALHGNIVPVRILNHGPKLPLHSTSNNVNVRYFFDCVEK